MSEQGKSLFAETVEASGAVAVHRCVGFDGAQADEQGQKVLGVSECAAVDGELFACHVIGTAIVETGAAVSRGDSLICDDEGRAIPASPLAVAAGATAVLSTAANGDVLAGSDPPEHVFADALQDAAGEGEKIEVLLRR